jgi:hypothetical protein
MSFGLLGKREWDAPQIVFNQDFANFQTGKLSTDQGLPL